MTMFSAVAEGVVKLESPGGTWTAVVTAAAPIVIEFATRRATSS